MECIAVFVELVDKCRMAFFGFLCMLVVFQGFGIAVIHQMHVSGVHPVLWLGGRSFYQQVVIFQGLFMLAAQEGTPCDGPACIVGILFQVFHFVEIGECLGILFHACQALSICRAIPRLSGCTSSTFR